MANADLLEALKTEIVRARGFVRAAETQIRKAEDVMALLTPCDPTPPDGDTSELPDPEQPVDPTEPEDTEDPHEDEEEPVDPEPDPPGEEPHEDPEDPPDDPEPEEPGEEPHEDQPVDPDPEEPPPDGEDPHENPEIPEEPEPDPEIEDPVPPHEDVGNSPPEAPAVTVEVTATTVKLTGTPFSDPDESDAHVYSRFMVVAEGEGVVTDDEGNVIEEDVIVIRDTGQVDAATEWTFGGLVPSTEGLRGRIYYSDGESWSEAGESEPFDLPEALNNPPDTPTPSVTDVGAHIAFVVGTAFSDPDIP